MAEYNGKSADGSTLVVSLKGSTSTALGGRLGNGNGNGNGRGGGGKNGSGLGLGLGILGESVDVLMGDDDEASSGGS